jgi:deazaflavin-dependent oxidoreductase (nitroreductase family)
VNDFNQQVIAEFRANGGKVGGRFEGMPMLLLTHTGAKSGTVRTTPLVHSVDGDDPVIIASKGGAPNHPHWFLNVSANPDVTVEVGSERYDATAVVTSGEERARLYRQQEEQMPFFGDYRQKTEREIPVIRLVRKG